MTFWHINFFIAAVDMILFYLIAAKASHQMKKRHPELCFIRRHWLEKYISFIETLVISICPGFNVLMLYLLISKDNDITETLIQSARERYAKQIEEESKE